MEEQGRLLRELGLPGPALNAAGVPTRAGASRMAPGVRAAMDAAAGASFDMVALHGAAGRAIAGHLGVPAALVTAGAAAALALGAAAAIARDDVGRMNRLPDVRGMRHGFLVARSHRTAYDRAVCLVGGRLVEVGISDRGAQAGVREAELGDFSDAVGEGVAGILYLARAGQEPSIAELAGLARAHDLVLLVDAAAQLGPATVPAELLAQGADLVAVSGGKGLAGPAGSGLLLGRADLVASALLQCLDTDYLDGTFPDEPALAAARAAGGRVPLHGVGRAMKVGKETIAGLVAAVGAYAACDHAAERARQSALLEVVQQGLAGANGLVAHRAEGRLEVAVDPEAAGGDAVALARALARAPGGGEAPVIVGHGALREGRLVISAACLAGEGEARAVARAIRAAAGG